MGRGEKIHLQVRTSDLTSLFRVCRATIKIWKDSGKLKTDNLKEIIDLYNQLNPPDKQNK